MWKVPVTLFMTACLITPVCAADCSHDADDLLTAVAKESSGKILADFKVKLDLYDREIIVGYSDGSQSLWFFAKGCMVSHPVILGPAPILSQPTPPSKPPLHGGGLEIGA